MIDRRIAAGPPNADLPPWTSDALVIAVADRTGIVIRANASFLQLAGHNPAGEPLARFVGRGQEAAFRAWLARVGADWVTARWRGLPDARGVDRVLAVSASRGPAGIVVVAEPRGATRIMRGDRTPSAAGERPTLTLLPSGTPEAIAS